MAKRSQKNPSTRRSFERDAAATATAQRQIQRKVDRSGVSDSEEEPEAMQAGARTYPVPPLPEQHLTKPGSEAELLPEPMYEAPDYKGSDKLEGKVALITGGDSGIGRSVAVLYAREGADVAIAYLNEHEDARRNQARGEKEGRRCITLSGDVADPAFCKHAVMRRYRGWASWISW